MNTIHQKDKELENIKLNVKTKSINNYKDRDKIINILEIEKIEKKFEI